MVISSSYSSISLIENDAQAIAVYPNPFSNELNIESPSRLIKVEILSLSGKMLSSTAASGFSTKMNLSQLAKGTYIVRVQNEEGVIIQKIVK